MKRVLPRRALAFLLGLILPMGATIAAVEIEILGTGTESLIGGDLTDPEDDGDENAGPEDESWNWVSIDADDEPGFEGGEFAFNVFDNVLGGGNDKWCCSDATEDSPRTITVAFEEPIQLTHFTLSSANDAPDRDPTQWEIQGSNDGAEFTTIFAYDEDEALWDDRLQVIQFTLDQPAAPYRVLRYEASETPGALHQIGEIEYFGEIGGGEDTDGDGIPDFWERIHGLDPAIDDASLDADGDGLTNLQEFEPPRTDPQNVDSDSDGLDDGLEVLTYFTNPTSIDTDGDGISDGVEVNDLKTDPTKSDTDGDSFDENIEIALGTDPLDSNDKPNAVAAVTPGVWTAPAVWSNGRTPSAENDYVVLNSVVSALETASGDFAGNSLALLGPDVTLSLTHAGIAHVNELVGQSATLTAVRSPTGLGGRFSVSGTTTINLGTRALDLRSQLSGSGAIRVTGTPTGSLSLNGIASGYDGSWEIVGTTVIVNTPSAIGSGTVTLVTGRLEVNAPIYAPEVTLDIRGDGFSLLFNAEVVYEDVRGVGAEGTEIFRLSELAEGVTEFSTEDLRNIFGIADEAAIGGTGKLSIFPNRDSDSDADGLRDSWEQDHFGDLSADGSGDSDGDGLTETQEFRTGADPFLADTDGDSLTDGEEVNTLGSSPILVDTDGDGISDPDEVNSEDDPNNPGNGTLVGGGGGGGVVLGGIDVTQPSDPIVLVDGENDDDGNDGPPPGAEGVEHAIDNVGQKYLHFLDLDSGFIVTPAIGSTVINGVRFYTANDAIERDPASFVIMGSNNGVAGPFALIAEGDLDLPEDRNPGGGEDVEFHQEIQFANSVAYTSYQVTFPTLRNADAANSMQIGEVELIGGPVGAATIEILGIGTEALLGNDLTDPENDGDKSAGPEDPSWNWVAIDSNNEPGFEGGEFSFNVFDNELGGGNAKWCCDDPSPDNPHQLTVEFTESVRLTHFTISSGNDSPDRDPTYWQIQGSNDGLRFVPIFVQDNDIPIWDERDQVALITLGVPSPAYSHIRFEVSDSPGDLYQLGELEYFGTTGGVDPDISAGMIDVVAKSPSSARLSLSEGITMDIEYSVDLVSWIEIASDAQDTFEDTNAVRLANPSGYYRGVTGGN
jgi:hypothetical protein